MKCYAPWHSLAVRFNGDLNADCVYTGRYGNLLTSTLPEILNSNDAISTKNSIRQNILPNECSQCTVKERTISHSRRIFFTQILKDGIRKKSWDYTSNKVDIRFLEFNMSNICNLKCRMCSGINSSAWIKEEIQLHQLNAAYDRPLAHPEFGYRTVDIQIIDKLFQYPEYFANLEYVSIKGGEPYMEDKNKIIFKRLIDMGINKNITLDVTTNGTIVDHEFHELAKQFKKTIWHVSIEGTDELYEYIRGSKSHNFETLNRNLEHYSIFDRVIITVTIMPYNICHLYKIQNWFNKLNKSNFEIYYSNIVATPAYLNPSILPQNILDYASTVNKHLNIVSIQHRNNNLLPIFVSYTRDLDKLRDTNVLDVCPELSSVFT